MFTSGIGYSNSSSTKVTCESIDGSATSGIGVRDYRNPLQLVCANELINLAGVHVSENGCGIDELEKKPILPSYAGYGNHRV